MSSRKRMLKDFWWCAAACVGEMVLPQVSAQTSETAAQESPPAQSQPDTNPAPTAKDLLAACAMKYKEAKSYRDEGEVAIEFDVSGQSVIDKKPFRTAFERDGRFHWQFTHAAIPGHTPTHTYTIWSKDQKAFESYWTVTRNKESFEDFNLAIVAPTGISGGSVTAIVPLLRRDLTWGIRVTEITDATITGSEKIDGHDCRKIEGTNFAGAVTLWLDDTLAIRKMYYVQEIDPSTLPALPDSQAANMQKFTSETTITIKPVFDETIDDDRFEPPADGE